MALALSAPLTVAFQPPAALPRVHAARSAVTMGVETELGATGPLGYWDPLGLVRRQTCTLGCCARRLARRIERRTLTAAPLRLR